MKIYILMIEKTTSKNKRRYKRWQRKKLYSIDEFEKRFDLFEKNR